MFGFILILIFVAVALASLAFGIIIFYHFKRFGLIQDLNKRKFLGTFSIGCSVLIFLNLIFLILIFVKK